jgi:hypothetical protein
VVVTNTGNVADTITSITTTSDYTENSNCSTLAPAATCSISVTFTPTIIGADNGTLAINASGAGTSITVPLTGAGNSFQWANTTNTASVPAGQTATFALTLIDEGYSGPVTYVCTNLPEYAACNLPAGSTLPGSGDVSVTATISTSNSSERAPAKKSPPKSALGAIGIAALLLLCAPRKRYRGALIICLIAFALIASSLTACGGGSSNNSGGNGGGGGGTGVNTPPGTYNITLTANGGNLSSATTLTLTIQ